MTSKYDFSAEGYWKKGKKIGTGGSSIVYEATIQHTNEIIAAKEIQIDGLSKEQVLAIEAEVNTIKSLEHKHIVNYLGTQLRGHYFYIFLEHADRGSLRQYYRKHGKLDEATVACCTKQLLLGLVYLHGNNIAHRDIKGANVLLTKGGEMKLADFGASKRYDTASIVSGLKGTPQWMAPEVIKGTQMTSGWMKADVWSLGCTVVEMLTGNLPYAEFENPMTAMYHIASGKTPSLDKANASPVAIDFIETCCNVDPELRPSVKDLLTHSFVKDIDDNMTIELAPDVADDEDVSPRKLSGEGPGQDIMSSVEMRVILSRDDRHKQQLHQSPDNSPPPSPPKDQSVDNMEDTCDNDELTVHPGVNSGGGGDLSRNVTKKSLLDSVDSLSSSQTEFLPTTEADKSRPPTLIQETLDDAAAALKVLEQQNTPSIYSTLSRKKLKSNTTTDTQQIANQFSRGDATAKKKSIMEDAKQKTSPSPPVEAPSSAYIRRQASREGARNISNPVKKTPSDLVDVANRQLLITTTSENSEGAMEICDSSSENVTTTEENSTVPKTEDDLPLGLKAPNMKIKKEKKKIIVKSDELGADTSADMSSCDSNTEVKDELSPLNNSTLPPNVLSCKRERQISTDSSQTDESGDFDPRKHNRPPPLETANAPAPSVVNNSLQNNKKMGFSKSFQSGDSASTTTADAPIKPLSLAKHLAKKLSHLEVHTHQEVDSDAGSTTGYCASNGSSSGDDYLDSEFDNDEDNDDDDDNEMGLGIEEKKVNVLRNGTSTPPMFHDKPGTKWDTAVNNINNNINNNNNSIERKKKSSKPKESKVRSDTNTPVMFHDGTNDGSKKSIKDSSSSASGQVTAGGSTSDNDNSRPIAPFTSEKLYLHNHLGADNFSRAGQGGAAAIRKEAALSLHTNHHHPHPHTASSADGSTKYSGYHAVAKHYTSYKKDSKRSKSANVGLTGSSKLVLPSLMSTTMRTGAEGGNLVVIPQLALRVIQSAPTVTRSLNLPPLKSSTPSNKKSKGKSSAGGGGEGGGGTGGVYGSDSEVIAVSRRAVTAAAVAASAGTVVAAAVTSGSGGKDLFAKSLRFVSDSAEREGGILAPRRE